MSEVEMHMSHRNVCMNADIHMLMLSSLLTSLKPLARWKGAAHIECIDTAATQKRATRNGELLIYIEMKTGISSRVNPNSFFGILAVSRRRNAALPLKKWLKDLSGTDCLNLSPTNPSATLLLSQTSHTDTVSQLRSKCSRPLIH